MEKEDETITFKATRKASITGHVTFALHLRRISALGPGALNVCILDCLTGLLSVHR